MSVDELRFKEAKIKVMSELSDGEGIGRLGEKLIHKILKAYFEPNGEYHEVSFLGSVADVKNDKEIIEVQTRAFDRLRPKLLKFLPEIPVTVVYPIISEKNVIWLDKETGELSKPHRSPRKGRALDVFVELIKLYGIAPHERLTVKLVFLSVDEYKTLDGWDKTRKRGASKIEKIPREVTEIIELKTLEDYRALIPKELGKSFTAKEFNKVTGLRASRAYYALKFLLTFGFAEREMGSGRAYVYTLKE